MQTEPRATVTGQIAMLVILGSLWGHHKHGTCPLPVHLFPWRAQCCGRAPLSRYGEDAGSGEAEGRCFPFSAHPECSLQWAPDSDTLQISFVSKLVRGAPEEAPPWRLRAEAAFLGNAEVQATHSTWAGMLRPRRELPHRELEQSESAHLTGFLSLK